MKHHRKQGGRTILIIAVFSGLILSSILYSLFVRGFTTVPAQAAGAEDYCRAGIYYLPNGSGEDKCGRAANCGGWDYDQANSIAFQDAKACWGGTHCESDTSPCEGNVPLCCYEVERTGDPMKCNFPERGFCHPQQCNAIPSNGNFECGNGDRCRCGSQLKTYCITIDKDAQGNHCANNESELVYKSLAQRLGNSEAPTTGVSAAPVATVEPTRPAGSCTAAEIPAITAPLGGGAAPGRVTISWRAVNTAQTYALRIDDIGNPWNGDCNNPNPGDVCVNDIPKGTTLYDFTGVEGHTYHFWVQSINHCNEWSKSAESGVTTPPLTTASTCRIQGYRILVGPIDETTLTSRWGYYIDTNANNSLTIFPPDAIKQLPVTVAGVTPGVDYQSNPFFLMVPGGQTYTVSIAPLTGYTVSSTFCANSITCHINLGSNATLQQGESRTITCPAGGYADLWWNFTPTALPTLAITPSGVPTTTLVPPTPTACSTLPMLVWRDESLRYTRTVVSYDGINIVETIALHLKQIIHSGVRVEVSLDNGATWDPIDSSQNDDYVVTIKNRNSEVIHLQVRLTNLCTQASEVLSEDIAVVPIPSDVLTVTPSGTQDSARSLTPALIIGGAILTALIVAGFMIAR